MIERGAAAAASRLVRRALELYAVHIAVVVVYVAVIALFSRQLHDPDDLNQFNIAVFVNRPVWEFIQALALRYRPVNLDVLPLYVVLLATFAPALWLMVRRPALVLVCSMAVYVAGRYFGWNLPDSSSGFWYFNPFAWQLLFFLGGWIALGGAPAVQSLIRTRTAFWLAISYLVFAFVVTTAIHNLGVGNLLPSWILQPFDPNDKTNLAPYRVLHLVALAVVTTRLLPAGSPVLQWRSLAPLITCGQNSLLVFCFGIVLSFCAHAAIELSENSIWIQVFVGAAGFLLMTAVAYGWSWSKQRHRMVLSPA
jgi:hypothetical protein